MATFFDRWIFFWVDDSPDKDVPCRPVNVFFSFLFLFLVLAIFPLLFFFSFCSAEDDLLD